jgi:O-antigen/teichoic acid export membrane protein
MAAAPAVPVGEKSAVGEIRTALRHTFVYGIGGMLEKGLAFALLPFYTHFLSPKDSGIVEILSLLMSLLGMFLNFGITAAFLRHYEAAKSQEEKRVVASTVFLFVLISGLIIMAVGLVFVRQASLLMLGPGVSPVCLLLSFSLFVLAYIAMVPYTYIRAKEASGTLVILDAAGTLIILILNIYFIAVLKMAVIGLLLSALISGALKFLVLMAWMLPAMRLKVEWHRMRGILAFGAPLIFSNLTLFTLNFSDRFFLQHFRGLDAVGIYGAGYKFGYMLNFLFIQPFNMMWQVRMYTIYRRLDHERIFSQVFVLYSCLLIAVALGLALFSTDIVHVMVDQRYASGAQVVSVVALSYVFLGMGYYLQLGMFLTSRTALLGKISALVAVLNLGLNWVLVPRFGMFGAAWATAAGFLSIAIASYYGSQRVCPLNLGVSRTVRGLAAAVAVFGLSTRLNPHTVLLGLLAKGLLLAIFPVLLWAARVFSDDDMLMLKSLRTATGQLGRRVLRLA